MFYGLLKVNNTEVIVGNTLTLSGQTAFLKFYISVVIFSLISGKWLGLLGFRQHSWLGWTSFRFFCWAQCFTHHFLSKCAIAGDQIPSLVLIFHLHQPSRLFVAQHWNHFRICFRSLVFWRTGTMVGSHVCRVNHCLVTWNTLCTVQTVCA